MLIDWNKRSRPKCFEINEETIYVFVSLVSLCSPNVRRSLHKIGIVSMRLNSARNNGKLERFSSFKTAHIKTKKQNASNVCWNCLLIAFLCCIDCVVLPHDIFCVHGSPKFQYFSVKTFLITCNSIWNLMLGVFCRYAIKSIDKTNLCRMKIE